MSKHQQWFYEQQNDRGEWSPVTTAEKPNSVTKGGVMRLRTMCGIRRPIRNIKPIPAKLRHLTGRGLATAFTQEK